MYSRFFILIIAILSILMPNLILGNEYYYSNGEKIGIKQKQDHYVVHFSTDVSQEDRSDFMCQYLKSFPTRKIYDFEIVENKLDFQSIQGNSALKKDRNIQLKNYIR